MIQRIIIVAVLAITPLVLSNESSAGDCYGYDTYRAPATAYRGRHHGHHQTYGRPVFPDYGRTHYGSGYGSRYNAAYRNGYNGHGGPYYGRSGRHRGGISLHFGL